MSDVIVHDTVRSPSLVIETPCTEFDHDEHEAAATTISTAGALGNPIGMSNTVPAVASSSSGLQLRETPEYISVFELELWKKREESRFRNYLRDEENKRMKELETNFQKNEMERETEYKKLINNLQIIETKLRNKMRELEIREIKINNNENEFNRIKNDFDIKLKRIQNEYKSIIKLNESQNNSKIQILNERIKFEEKKKTQIIEQYESLLQKQTAMELTTTAKKNKPPPPTTTTTTTVPIPAPAVCIQCNEYKSQIFELNAKIQIKDFEIKQLMEKESKLNESRNHFRTTLIQLIQQQQQQQLPGRPTPPTSTTAALIAKRDDMLNSGLYTHDDIAIQAINQQIQESIDRPADTNTPLPGQ